MASWPSAGPLVPPVISPWWMPPNHIAQTVVGNISGTWGVANRAWYHPVILTHPIVVTKLWWQNGTTIAGNLDCGIYDEQGHRLLSTGSTAQAGTTAIQSVDVPDTAISAGLVYLALAGDSGTSSIWVMGNNTTASGIAYSVYLQLSAFPLPAIATFASEGTSGNLIYKYGAIRAPRTVV
jgi:hypothetical protein